MCKPGKSRDMPKTCKSRVMSKIRKVKDTCLPEIKKFRGMSKAREVHRHV